MHLIRTVLHRRAQKKIIFRATVDFHEKNYKKAVWMAPMILSTQLSVEVLAQAQIASCSHPGDNCVCTPAGGDSCSRCEIKQFDNLTNNSVVCGETGCSTNCDWRDGASWYDIRDHNFQL